MSAIAMAAPAVAQTKLYVLFQGTPTPACSPGRECQLGSVMVLDVDTRQIESSTFVFHARTAQDVQVTSDGRYVLWIGAEDGLFIPKWLTAFDIVSRAFTPVIRVPDLSHLFAHPSRVQAYYQAGRDIVAVDATATRVYSPACESPVLESMSHDGSRLFVRCGEFRQPLPYLVYGAATGVQVAAISVHAGASRSAPTADGRAFFVMSVDSSTPAMVFSKYDVQTGALLAERSEQIAGIRWQMVDPRSGDLYMQPESFPAPRTTQPLLVLDGTSLAVRARVSPPLPDGVMELVFDPEAPRAFVLTRSTGTTHDPVRTRIDVFDTNQLAFVSGADLPSTVPPAGLVLGPRPPRPSNLSAAVDASRNLSLSWNLGTGTGMATELVLEAGSRPGSADLAQLHLPATATTFSVPGVPPGTYYMRVRAANYTGLGTPSNEVTITVPASP